MRYRHLRFPEGKFKAVTFSYDDGVRADIRLSKMFKNYGLKASFNINSGHIGTGESDRLTAQEIKENILDLGHEITNHGHDHLALGCVTPIDGIRDVLEGRTVLEQTFGIMVRGMAYADSGITHMENGTNYQTIKNYLQNLGVAYARTLSGDNDTFRLPEDWYAWMPSAHHNNPQIFQMIDKFLALDKNVYYPNSYSRLLYIWGHSYEFEDNNNWDRIEEICQKLSNKDDIWYATNIEIHDYVEAYNSLIFSADNSMVYNPSLLKIWFEVDGKVYSVASGETIKL